MCISLLGGVKQVPNDRKLRKDMSIIIPNDLDVDNIWWPDLESWLKKNYSKN